MEPSETRPEREAIPAGFRPRRSGKLCLGALVMVAASIGCGYPDYTYADRSSAGSSGTGATGGTGGTGGAGATGGSGGTGAAGAAGGTAGEGGRDGGDAEAQAPDAEDDRTDDVDASEEPDAPNDEGSEEADAPDAPEEADAPPDVEDECEGMVEDCTNGVDDDCDGMGDCRDPDCSAFTCTHKIPVGWTGYVAYYEGASAGVPSCPTPYPDLDLVAGRNPAPAPATCTTCSCGPPTGVQCGLPEVTAWQNTTCNSPGYWPVVVSPLGDCFLNVFADGQPASVSVFDPPQIATAGSCVASGGSPSTQSPTWNTLGVACRRNQAGGGCSANAECVPKPPPGFNTGICIYRDGDHTCPSPYLSKSLLFQGFSDSRTCSACTCGLPTGASCSGVLTVSQSGLPSQCSATQPEVEFIASSAGCYAGLDPKDQHYFEYEPGPPKGGTCLSQGGQPVGSVSADPGTAFTVCCRPY